MKSAYDLGEVAKMRAKKPGDQHTSVLDAKFGVLARVVEELRQRVEALEKKEEKEQPLKLRI